MRVYIEQTAQKNILKFVCDEIITSGSLELTASSNLMMSKLAQHLFQFPFVEKVFISANFVAIQKNEMVEWEDVAQSLKELINKGLEDNTIIEKEEKKEPYTLYAEMTPNPKVMKFVSNQTLASEIVEVTHKNGADKVPLAGNLYNRFDFIEEVFISNNYISLTRSEKVDWQDVALELRHFILDFLQSGKTIVEDDYKVISSKNKEQEIENNKEYNEVEKEIQRILKEYIQPAVANDGGNIALVEFNEKTKTATMLLQGACSGCPSSTITLKNGIETILKDMLPNVVEHVEAING